MIRNILEYLEKTVRRVPDKVAFYSEEESLTFAQLSAQAQAVGSELRRRGFAGGAVAVWMGKNPRTVAAFLGVLYAGGFYVPLDAEMPESRMEKILGAVSPWTCIVDGSGRAGAEKLMPPEKCMDYESLAAGEIAPAVLKAVRDGQIDTDPAYVVFTSGSTGMPKGVVGSHGGVVDYMEGLCEALGFDETTVFGNQSPLYYDACLKEIVATLKFGATTCLIPRRLFLTPVPLVEYLNREKINTLCWVVPALTYISAWGTLDTVKPNYLRTVAFASEVFPPRQLNRWLRALPDTNFFNLYGPTEATGVCCFHRVTGEVPEGEMLPVGRAFRNTRILLLDEQNREPPAGEMGEICVAGSRLTNGYWGDREKTEQVFLQNPRNPWYRETVYRTGDMGKFNENGELIFLFRKDNQIKRMGHRIELEEIEAAARTLPGVESACCVFRKETEKILLYYVGYGEGGELRRGLGEKLPRYFLPNRVIRLETMPRLPNGKTDRNCLRTRRDEHG